MIRLPDRIEPNYLSNKMSELILKPFDIDMNISLLLRALLTASDSNRALLCYLSNSYARLSLSFTKER